MRATRDCIFTTDCTNRFLNYTLLERFLIPFAFLGLNTPANPVGKFWFINYRFMHANTMRLLSTIAMSSRWSRIFYPHAGV